MGFDQNPARSLLTTASATALFAMATPALGQDAPTDSRAAAPPVASTVEAPSTTAMEPPSDEIVVTAQKRDERLSDVPISVAVLNGRELDRSSANSLRDALNGVPGVSITTNQNGSPQVTVRGVSASAPRFAGTNVTGYYLDTVPFGLVKSAIVPDVGTYDLQRVEVLRGPQGTLYGASALNGVVRILTSDPDLGAFEVKARALTSSTEHGDWNYRGDTAVNVPLIDGKLAIRGVVSYSKVGGWIDRPNEEDANDTRSSTIRLKVRARPTDPLTIDLSYWRSRIDNGATDLSDEHYFNGNRAAEPNFDNFDAYGGRVRYDFRGFTVSSMTSYLKYEAGNVLDVVPFGLAIVSTSHVKADVFSEELIANSTSTGPWKWSVGAMYRDGSDFTTQDFSGVPVTDLKDSSRSVAVFGEVTRALFDGKVELTGGLRYFHDRVKTQDFLIPTTRANDTFKALTPRLVLSLHPSDGALIYASYARGFRSGTEQYVNVLRLGLPAAKPDKLDNFELGAKGDLFGRLISYDAAVYYMKWRDVQENIGVPVTFPDGSTTFTTALVNGDSASGLGFDLGLSIRPVPRMSLGVNMSYNGLKLDSDVISRGTLFARAGDRLNNSPEFSAGPFVNYEFPIGANLNGRLSLSANYVSKQKATFALATPAQYGEDTFIANAALALASSDRWTATLFADNLTNERNTIYNLNTPVGGSYMRTRPQPRTIGVQVEIKFR